MISEKKIFCESLSFIDSLKDIYAVYYVFDIAYPKPLRPLLLFLQRVVFEIKDKTPLPPAVVRLLSMLDNQ